MCLTCQTSWALAIETSDRDYFRLVYSEQHEYPKLPSLQRRAAAGCTFCCFLRSVILEESKKWLDLPVSDLTQCLVNILPIEILLSDASPSSDSEYGGRNLSAGQCRFHVEFLENAISGIETIGKLELCELPVIMNYGMHSE